MQIFSCTSQRSEWVPGSTGHQRHKYGSRSVPLSPSVPQWPQNIGWNHFPKPSSFVLLYTPFLSHSPSPTLHTFIVLTNPNPLLAGKDPLSVERRRWGNRDRQIQGCLRKAGRRETAEKTPVLIFLKNNNFIDI